MLAYRPTWYQRPARRLRPLPPLPGPARVLPQHDHSLRRRHSWGTTRACARCRSVGMPSLIIVMVVGRPRARHITFCCTIHLAARPHRHLSTLVYAHSPSNASYILSCPCIYRTMAPPSLSPCRTPKTVFLLGRANAGKWLFFSIPAHERMIAPPVPGARRPRYPRCACSAGPIGGLLVTLRRDSAVRVSQVQVDLSLHTRVTSPRGQLGVAGSAAYYRCA
jgi:hypothetical protein